MLIYEMNLNEIPFAMIKSRQKCIEMRLNKKGREKIKPGDQLVFTNNKTGEKLIIEVTLVSKYSSFVELYKHFDKTDLGYRSDEVANPDDMLEYYSQDDIDKYGVLAIGVKLL